ncbi:MULTISPECIES: AI-2E family transporter [unclassified Modestobacter]|uniref:AI-2E family transporter n=1 Tax=unclassified Modestobacter TaxID=2643866 RepID=UPI0022AA2D04|nr:MULTISPECIES: AI-2E family transporter [unclassified Modestobacter]MCZ2823292.1 AI-2E family transporter [Modestobacter sp. VKM Ac-2981]MCZ2851537.1 AI-2E family transporter [Modestobacter sp. VKM Ac-2982]
MSSQHDQPPSAGPPTDASASGQAGTATDAGVPAGVRTAGMWCLWTLAIGAVVYFAVQLAVVLGTVVLTFLGGLLLTALLRPVASWLDRTGLPRLAATWLVMVLFLVLLGGVGYFLQQRVAREWASLRPTLVSGLDRVRTSLVETLGLPRERVNSIIDGLIAQLTGGFGGGAGGPGMVVTGATTAVTVAAGLVLALFTAFWLIYDGARIWRLCLRIVPADRRAAADDAGNGAWHTLGGYLRGTTAVALIDAVGIGLALLLIGVPLAFALAVLTFLGAYIPVVGAFVAGLAAVVVAFAAGGLTDALLVLGAVVVVQQIEGNLLQPLIMRRTVFLHPLGIVYALTVGGLLWGIGGAVIAVPLAAVVYAIAVALADRKGGEEPEPRPRGLRLRTGGASRADAPSADGRPAVGNGGPSRRDQAAEASEGS